MKLISALSWLILLPLVPTAQAQTQGGTAFMQAPAGEPTSAEINAPGAAASATDNAGAAPATAAITGITQYVAPAATPNTGQAVQYIAQITGTNLPDDTPRVSLLPSPTTGPTVASASPSGVMIAFSAPAGFSITQAVLSYKSGITVESASMVATSCQFKNDINSTFQFIDADAAKTMYGAGVAKNFRVIKLSIVNQCALPITIPLPGIRIKVSEVLKTDCPKETSTNKGLIYKTIENPTIIAMPSISPSSLDAVTAFYTEDKSVTGRRALFFNSVAALAAVGSGIEPFIGGRGFAQAIAFVGGGFTSSAQLLYKDMSAQQLQALTSLGFGNAEQLSAHNGALQKYLFVSLKIDDDTLQCALRNKKVTIKFTVIPTVTSGEAQSLPAQNP